jgi:hypothetical protein
MSGRRLLRCVPVLALVFAAVMPAWTATPKPATAPKIDPRAVQMLQQMGEYLKGLQTFSVHVATTRDVVLASGQVLDSDLAYDLMVRRPDGLRVNMTSAAGGAEIFYDGKTLAVYTPARNYYAVTPAPPTIQETIAAALKKGISMPLADLLSKEAGKNMLANTTSATYVGTSMVGGVLTNHLAFRQKSLDWQIWIEDGQTPLPVRLVIVDRREKDSPRFVAAMSDWNVNPTFDASTFAFTPPAGATKINFGQLPRLRPAPVR